MILQSRMNNHNISEGEKTHEIVINRLIELWQLKPFQTNKLFNDIAVMLSQFDDPNPIVYYNKGAKEWRGSIRKNGKYKIIKRGSDKKQVEHGLNEYLINNY